MARGRARSGILTTSQKSAVKLVRAAKRQDFFLLTTSQSVADVMERNHGGGAHRNAEELDETKAK